MCIRDRPLREGVDLIADKKTGALIVVGSSAKLDKISSGGINLYNCKFTPEMLCELAKMDGAIIVDENVDTILKANVHLNPSDLIETSKRETFEEIGIIKENMNFQFKLTDIYIPPSNFLVRPYIFIIENTPLLNPNRDEVVKVIKPKLTSLMNLNIQYGYINEKKIECPFFLIENHVVWGATAMILNEFLSLFDQ
mgnify:CR=1 FL=1